MYVEQGVHATEITIVITIISFLLCNDSWFREWSVEYKKQQLQRREQASGKTQRRKERNVRSDCQLVLLLLQATTIYCQGQHLDKRIISCSVYVCICKVECQCIHKNYGKLYAHLLLCEIICRCFRKWIWRHWVCHSSWHWWSEARVWE